MCGRFALFSNINVILKYADMIEQDMEWRPHYNIAPSMIVPVIRGEKNTAAISFQKWGYLPHFFRDNDKGSKSFAPINVKSETITEKPIFRESFKKRRCLVPANGFYEWRKPDRQPFFITLRETPLMLFAGIWIPDTFAIITTEANEILRPVHDRMPVIIHPKKMRDWLFSGDQDDLKEILAPYPSEEMELRPVSKEVNKSGTDHPGLIAEA